MCQIEPSPPEWVTFEIKTTMKDKFGPNATPISGKPTEILADYKKNISRHAALAETSLLHGDNDYSLAMKEFKMLKEIKLSLKNEQIAGYKITVGLDDRFNPSQNSKYDKFFIVEDLAK